MAIIQISKIQQRSGNLVDLPQLDEAEFGFASDAKKLYIGKTTPNENIEILTSYSSINFDALQGSYGNLNINPLTAQNGQVLTFDGNNWVNRGGSSGGVINLGDVSNVKIDGGAIGYILETDGTGNLSWGPKGTIIAFIENVVPALIPTNQTIATATTTGTNIITVGNSSGYTANAPVTFSGTGFGGITAGALYYINFVPSSTGVTISTTPGGSNVALSTATGTLTLNIVGTILTTTENNFLTEGAEVTITDAVGMTELNGNTYYIDLLTSNSFALFTNPGLTTPLYSNSYSPYAYTALIESFNSNYAIEVSDSSLFNLNEPVRFIGSLGNSDLETNTTYYVNALPSSTTMKVSATIVNGVAGNAYPVQDELFAGASVYVEGGRVIAPVGGSQGTVASGSNTTIQFNNNNLLDGDASLTWNYGVSPKVLAVTGNANITGNLNATVSIISPILVSNVATGTAPLTVTSTTRVANLNVARANVSDFSNVLSLASGTGYLLFADNSPTNNYQLESNANLGFNIDTGNLSATILNANGNINAGGNLTVTGNATVGNLIGALANGNSNVSIPAANGNVNISAIGNANVLVVTGTGVNVAGTVNATGNLNAANLIGVFANGNSNVNIPAANGNVNLSAVGNANVLVVTGTGINVAGTINATGNLNVANLSGVFANGNSNVSIPAANGNVNISAIGNANVLVVTGTGVNVAGTINATGNLNAANLSGIIRPTSGSTTAGIIFPDNPGGGAGDTASIKYYSYSGDDSVLDITVTDNANDYIKLNATGGTTVENSLRVNGSANVTGNLTISNTAIITTGNITTVNTGVVQNGNSNVSIPAANGNVNLSAVGNANVLVVTGTGVNVAGTLNATGNANVGNIGGTDAVFTTLGGTLTTAAQPNITSVGTLISLAVTGNVTAGNVYANSGTIGASLLTGTLTTAAQPNITSVGTLLSLSVTGNISGNNISTANYFLRSVGTGISANGTNQSQATGLTKEINVVSTVTSGTGVRLPTAVAGMAIIITNTSANNLLVYPNTSGIINSLAANAGYTMPASATLQFVAPTTTQWYTVGASYA